MKRFILLCAWALPSCLAAQSWEDSPNDSPACDPHACDEACQLDVARIRKLTEKYADPAQADSDGYYGKRECADSPSGTMGEHRVNLALELDDSLDVEKPEILLYVPGASGKAALAGVEYSWVIKVAGTPYYGQDPPPGNPECPVLFGHRFYGPMRGHQTEQPWHCDLHLWLDGDAQQNGMFSPWSPSDCTGYKTVNFDDRGISCHDGT